MNYINGEKKNEIRYSSYIRSYKFLSNISFPYSRKLFILLIKT